MDNVRRITQQGGTHRLRDLFESWGVPSEFHAGMSPCWECRLAPSCPTDGDMLRACIDGVPLLAPSALAGDAFRAVGDDAIEYIQRPEWNAFPKPRIAMIGGWGAPGTHVLGEDHLTLVQSFSELMRSDQKINLQMFHREGPDMPALPRLPDLLRWPLPGLLDGEDGSWGIRCDAATRVSRQGALTWWHLDDGGEFVLQVGLPISGRSLKGPVLMGPTGRPVVKLFIFAEKQHYDFITQDAVTNETSKFSQLHLFETPSEHLPIQPPDAACALPKFWIAPLEAGGQLLLSPANLPHCVITLQDCVMVEVRKIFLAFLDEVTYFLQRASLWLEPPIFYPFISDDLREPAKVRLIVRQLVHALERTADQGASGSGSSGSAIAADAGHRAMPDGTAEPPGLSCATAEATEAAGGLSRAFNQFADALAAERGGQDPQDEAGVRSRDRSTHPRAHARSPPEDCPPDVDDEAGGSGHPSGVREAPLCKCSNTQPAAATRASDGSAVEADGLRTGCMRQRRAGGDRKEPPVRRVGARAECSGRPDEPAKLGRCGQFDEELWQCRRSRAFHSLQALLGCDFVVMDEATRAAAAAALASAAADGLRTDPRAPVQAALSEGMRRSVKGVVELGSRSAPGAAGTARFAAYVHVLGRPRWGPVRNSAAQAKLDRKFLLEAKRSGRLDEALAGLHHVCAAEACAAGREGLTADAKPQAG